MKIATAPAAADPALAWFEESPRSLPAVAGCRCHGCAARPRTPVRAGRPGASRIHRTVRGTCLATTVMAGAGVLGLSAGTGAAHAAPAPVKQGWDGSRYWFKGAGGEWRYTSHYDVYLNRIGRSPAAPDPGRESADAAPDSDPVGTEAAVAYALAQVGKPYLWGGDGPGGFDCSGLVQQAFLRSGVTLPRVANDQYAASTPIDAGDLRRGDLLFWSDSGRASAIHHVGIYLGGGRFVEAPRPGRDVRVSTLSAGFYPTHFGRP